MTGPVVWFEALGQHGDTLHGFYREVLGWEFEPRQPETHPAPRARGRALPRWRRRERVPTRPPWWVTFYTPVADLDAAIARARALGSRVLVAPTRHGEVTIAVISDPEGHPIGLCA